MKRKLIHHGAIVHSLLCAAAFVCAATGIGWLFRLLQFPETNIVVVYILSVILTARFTNGYIWGILATLLSTCAFNIFFTQPYFALSVDDPTYFITFTIMAITSVITSALTSKAKKMTAEAVRNGQESGALYYLTSHLADAESADQIAEITVETVSRIMDCKAACLCFDEKGRPERTFIQQKAEFEQIRRCVSDPDMLRHRIENLRTDYDAGEEFCDWPIYGSESVLGVLRIPKERAQTLTSQQKKLLHSMIESTAMAMDRLRVMKERIRSREEAAQERYRGNLLRAISHDLRTPLAGIMGTSEMIMDATDKSDARYALADGIYKDADWLHGLVENILSLTRLQDGRLTLRKELEPVEEVIGAAVAATEKRVPGREISVHIPAEILMIPMDARLIGQVLMNLMDNAIKHTQQDEEISVTVSKDSQQQMAVFTVADRGTGIAARDLPNIFQMFYTTKEKSADAKRGIGLGLAICDSIVTAHGGTITAHNQENGKGAVFTFTLPLEENTDDQAQ
ncbi:MAG: ATP-binding protein [Eubacteriales bacterium]